MKEAPPWLLSEDSGASDTTTTAAGDGDVDSDGQRNVKTDGNASSAGGGTGGGPDEAAAAAAAAATVGVRAVTPTVGDGEGDGEVRALKPSPRLVVRKCPPKVAGAAKVTLWHLQDRVFRQPRVEIYLKVTDFDFFFRAR